MKLHLGWLGCWTFCWYLERANQVIPFPFPFEPNWILLNSSSHQIVGRHPFPVLSLDVTRQTDFKRRHIMTRILYCIARHSSVGLSESFWAVLIACEEIKAGFNFIHAMKCVDEEFWVSCPPSSNRSKASIECVNSFQLMTYHVLKDCFRFRTWRHVFAKALLIIQILPKAGDLSTHTHTELMEVCLIGLSYAIVWGVAHFQMIAV